jgi:pimeloyl-ACP methyl ester carboxylesterase
MISGDAEAVVRPLAVATGDLDTPMELSPEAADRRSLATWEAIRAAGTSAEVELSAGTIAYEDTGGAGPAVVFLHGLLMDGSLWRAVVAELRQEFRCILPVLPLGGHRRPMRPDADVSMRGIANLVGELLERLDLKDVCVVANDWGGILLVVADEPSERIGSLILTSCEAFDNVPPGLPGRMIARAARIPGGVNLAIQQLRLRPLRRLPLAWGLMSKRPVPTEVMDAWFRPASRERRDPPRPAPLPAQRRAGQTGDGRRRRRTGPLRAPSARRLG